jgi:hypothetical protein
MPLKGAGNIYAQAMRKGSNRAEALRKRKIEKELKELGYSHKKAKQMVAELDGPR